MIFAKIEILHKVSEQYSLLPKFGYNKKKYVILNYNYGHFSKIVFDLLYIYSI